MKQILFICFLFSSTPSFSQSTDDIPVYTNNYKTYGYIGGKRLDSVDAVYAQFSWRGNRSLLFDYGQIRETRKTLSITNSNGKALTFTDANDMNALNFFYFNGWQLDHVTGTSGSNTFFLKKRTAQ